MLFSLENVRFDAAETEQIGGKAVGICWLRSRGFPAPRTWVLTTRAFDAMMEAAGIAHHIAVLEKITDGRPDWVTTELALQSFADLRDELIQALMTTPLPGPVQSALESLPPNEPFWAVRSSATVEDDGHHSFAGQFSTSLSVPAGASIVKAVRGVWASTFSKTALHYRAEHGTAMPRMAVILQPMPPITAEDRAGVAFSESPVPGMPGILLQTTYGAGLTVMSGGGELKCVGKTGVRTPVAHTPQVMVTSPEGGLQAVSGKAGGVLDDEEALILAQKVQEIARLYGRPADVEFIWPAQGDPVFLQVRTITGTAAPPAI